MVKGFIVYATYKVDGKKADVYLLGRLEDGRSFLSFHEHRPYFYIPTSLVNKAKELLPGSIEFKGTKEINFRREKVTRVTATLPKDIPGFRKTLQEEGIPCYEADIRYAMRYMINNNLKGGIEFLSDGTPNTNKDYNVDVIFSYPEFKPADVAIPLKVLSFDIETDMNAKNLFSISFYGKDLQKVLLVGDKDVEGADLVQTQEMLLKRFSETIIDYDPDVIVGWNCIDFDLNILKNKFAEYGIKFKFGRLPWEASLRIQESFFIDSSADVPGRMVLDGIHLLKSSFIKLPDYKLQTAAKHFLNEGKLLEGEGRFLEIENLYKEDPKRLVEYNLKDSKLVYDIFYKSKLLDLTILRSKLTRMSLDRVGSSIASLDSVYIEELRKIGVVAPTANVQEREERIKGGYVMTGKPGIYDNVLVFDFKSLYPSIILTFNIDPYSYVEKDLREQFEKKDVIIAPNGAYFRRELGILPQIIKQLWHERDVAKKEGDKVKANAIKILMNSFFGVLANPACRFYSIDVANAITHFGQDLIKRCASELEGEGHEVIYGDTDSLFISTPKTSEKEALEGAKKIEEKITKFLRDHITTTYDRECFMELEFEKLYHRFFMPRVRDSESGAKKRYAGLLIEEGKEEIQFVGLESVRRDWTKLAKVFQEELLLKVFHKEEVESFIKEFVKNVKEGTYDELLVYRKAIRKKVSSYTKTTPPHIQAARKAGIEGVGIIDYVITSNGPEVVEKTTAKIDYDHYIDKQVRPIAESVLQFFDQTFDELLQGHKQASLGDF